MCFKINEMINFYLRSVNYWNLYKIIFRWWLNCIYFDILFVEFVRVIGWVVWEDSCIL